MRRARSTGVAVLALVVSCHDNRVQHATAPPKLAPPASPQPSAAPQPERSSAVAPLPGCDLSDREHLFLVHTKDHRIVVKSSATECITELVARASGDLYDPALDLLWYRDRELLHVLDLRAPGAEPVTIAQGMPEEDRLDVTRGKHLASVEDGCDLAYVSLAWTARPKIKAYITQAPGLKIVNTDWLSEQYKRPLRRIGERQEFSEDTIALPDGVAKCEDEEECGTTVAFGTQMPGRGLQLVRVLEGGDGDCAHQSCLLYEARTKRWASPFRPTSLGAASAAAPGPCGLFMFDRAQRAYLVEHSLCSVEAGCRNIGGSAIGWLDPGDTVGEPGAGEWQEP